MKKFLLIMITVLTVISLVACSASGISEEEAEKRTQAKLDEAAETYGEFIKYRYVLEKNLWYEILSQYGENSVSNVDLTLTNSEVCEFIRYLYATEDQKVEVWANDCSFTEGKRSGTAADATISGVTMKANYKVMSRADDEDVKEDVKDKEITISEGSYKATSASEDSDLSSVSMKATINGKEYSLEYKKSGSEYTYASVNGKEVAPKFLDALDTYGNTEWY